MSVFVIIPESILAAAATGQVDPNVITSMDDDESEVENSSEFPFVFDQETSSFADSVELHKQRCPLLSRRHVDGEGDEHEDLESHSNSYHMPLNDSNECYEDFASYTDYDVPLNDSSEGKIGPSAVTIPHRRRRLVSLDSHVHQSHEEYGNDEFGEDYDEDSIDFPSFQFSQPLSMSEQICQGTACN
ncbi:unnamed protein product [Cylindrotheca closterium]|uniref:Uncharacterized protein n=1 Tax=Cylindrotheca closterium TaxID=2856 RepID=A0AAD2CQS2_9STRA|nr:unnamed protein product [Cylindrotheca closterium]